MKIFNFYLKYRQISNFDKKKQLFFFYHSFYFGLKLFQRYEREFEGM